MKPSWNNSSIGRKISEKRKKQGKLFVKTDMPMSGKSVPVSCGNPHLEKFSVNSVHWRDKMRNALTYSIGRPKNDQ